MSITLGVVMDPIESINTKKDSTFAMLLEGQRRNYPLWYIQPRHLWVEAGRAFARAAPVSVRDDPDDWFELGPVETRALDELDVLLMRKDPPFDMEYVFDTYVLDAARRRGTLVVNRPSALRDINEKAAILEFPQFTPATVIARDHQVIRQFVIDQGEAVVKPLDGMGGFSIFRTSAKDPNLNVVIETVGQQGRSLIMAQGYVAQITEGDKRILLIDGQPVPFALARIPSDEDFRGNLAKGGRGVAVPLSDADRAICDVVGPWLKDRGVVFAGLDVIGDRLTEINVTSPTCIRELDAAHNLNIAGQLMDCIESKLHGTP